MSRAFTHKIVIVCTFMLKNVASLLKRRLKVKYYVLGSILHELHLLEFF